MDFVLGLYFFNEDGFISFGLFVFSLFNIFDGFLNDGIIVFFGDYGYFDIN